MRSIRVAQIPFFVGRNVGEKHRFILLATTGAIESHEAGNHTYTNNLIERLMGEIAKRVKNKWMHWSTTGLENLLNILLIRYCNRQRYNKLKEGYLNQEHTFIHITVI